MVRKLIKYDFKAFSKVMIPTWCVLLGLAAVYRIISFFETDTTAYEIFNVSAIVILVVATITTLLMTFIFSIVRFYKNLFTTEGYLTLTLPVSTQAHITSKFIVSLIFDALTVVATLAAFCIATAGDVLQEVVKAGTFMFGKVIEVVGGQTWAYVIECIVLAIVALASAHLLTYACISIGQTARKHKILLAVGIYFAVYVVKQIIATTFISIGVTTRILDDIVEFFRTNPRASLHIVLIGAALLEIILGAVSFIVTRAMIKNKLNLE